MITRQVTRSFGFLKTTAIGGIFFLLPLVVIGFLLGQVISVVAVVAQSLAESGAGDYVPAQSPIGYAVLFVSAIALIVLGCFACGVVARRSIARSFTRSIEKYLLMLFPRYAIFKEQLSGNIGGEHYKTQLTPVLVRFDDFQKLAFEIDHDEVVEGAATDLVTVYLPGSPDPWNGTVVLVEKHQVTPLQTDFLTACGTFEQLGNGMRRLISASLPADQKITPADSTNGSDGG